MLEQTTENAGEQDTVTGTPNKQTTVHLQKRIQEAVKTTESGCWEWQKSRTAGGYGRIKVGGKAELAHRVSYRAFRGAIQEGYDIDHQCGNPACVNPEHLVAQPAPTNRRRGRAPSEEGVHRGGWLETVWRECIHASDPLRPPAPWGPAERGMAGRVFQILNSALGEEEAALEAFREGVMRWSEFQEWTAKRHGTFRGEQLGGEVTLRALAKADTAEILAHWFNTVVVGVLRKKLAKARFPSVVDDLMERGAEYDQALAYARPLVREEADRLSYGEVHLELTKLGIGELPDGISVAPPPAMNLVTS